MSIKDIEEEINKVELRERIVQTLLEKLCYVTMRETQEIYQYEDGVYKLGIAEATINEHAEMMMDKNGTRFDINEIIFHLKCRSYIDWNYWEVEDKFVCLKNGILNIENLMLQPHSAEFHFLNKLPVEYYPQEDLEKYIHIDPLYREKTPEEKVDLIDKFFHQIVATQEDVDALYEFFGYCLYRRMPIHKAIMLVGDGENGKSTLLNLLKAFLGSDNVSHQSLQDICQNRFAAVELHGKLANIFADITQKALYETGMFKMLSGEDTLDAEKKFVQRRFKFQNYAKQIYSCNVIPANEKDDTIAFWRRWILITFPNRFSKELGNVDPDILQKLTTPNQLSLLLFHSLEGLKRLLRNNGFSNQKTVEETRQNYIIKSDPIKYFAEEKLEQDSENWHPKTIVYEAYKQFCKERKLEIKDMVTFSRKLRKHITFSDIQKNIDGKPKVWCYGGIKLKGLTQQVL
jgi:putative DNA primase/helicase